MSKITRRDVIEAGINRLYARSHKRDLNRTETRTLARLENQLDILDSPTWIGARRKGGRK